MRPHHALITLSPSSSAPPPQHTHTLLPQVGMLAITTLLNMISSEAFLLALGSPGLVTGGTARLQWHRVAVAGAIGSVCALILTMFVVSGAHPKKTCIAPLVS